MTIPVEIGLIQAPVMVAQLFNDVDGFLVGPQVAQAIAELLVAFLTSLLFTLFPSLAGGT